MRVIFGMAAEAVRGRPGKHAVHMTDLAFNFQMPAQKRESGLIVIEGGPFPTIGGVATSAILAELSLVGVIGSVAGSAIGGCTGETLTGMAGFAFQVDVQPGQGEISLVMIESSLLPAGRYVAYLTGLAKLPGVSVVNGVTGVAVLRGSL